MRRILAGIVLGIGLLQPVSACTWVEKLFGTCTDNNPVGFVPTFEKVHQVSRLKGNIALNDTYYATEATTQVVMKKFGASKETQVFDPTTPDSANMLDSGGPAFQRYVVFPVGAILRDETNSPAGQVKVEFSVNAGIIADYYRRIPEKQFPATDVVVGNPPVVEHRLSTAEQFVWRMIWGIGSESEASKAKISGRLIDPPSKIEEDKQNALPKSERVY